MMKQIIKQKLSRKKSSVHNLAEDNTRRECWYFLDNIYVIILIG